MIHMVPIRNSFLACCLIFVGYPLMTQQGGGRVEEISPGVYRVWMDDGRCSKWKVPGVKITRSVLFSLGNLAFV